MIHQLTDRKQGDFAMFYGKHFVFMLSSAVFFSSWLNFGVWAQTPPSSTSFPIDAQVLSPQTLKERVAGKQFRSRFSNGVTALFKYGSDNALQLDLSTGLSARGTWRIEGSQICLQFDSGVPSGCSESRVTPTHLYIKRYTNQEVLKLEETTQSESTARATPSLQAVFYAVPTDRTGVTMNIAMLEPGVLVDKVLLVVPGTPGSEGRIIIENAEAAAYGKLQYFYPHAELFKQAGIALVAMGCPTDQWARAGQCDDDYRSSQQYVDDVSGVIQFLRKQYAFKDFYVFGHSSGGISSRWLSLKMPDQLKGAVNSSAMNGTAGTLARSMWNFDMTAVKIPVLNIAHEQDECRSTPYAIVRRYSHNNLVTVRGGGQTGFVCGGANRHSFEDRQRGVSRAIINWITTGQVQTYIDSDD